MDDIFLSFAFRDLEGCRFIMALLFLERVLFWSSCAILMAQNNAVSARRHSHYSASHRHQRHRSGAPAMTNVVTTRRLQAGEAAARTVDDFCADLSDIQTFVTEEFLSRGTVMIPRMEPPNVVVPTAM
jgi:hypothetical protein